jgi:tetratricopeptide (TPR) repeat protein
MTARNTRLLSLLLILSFILLLLSGCRKPVTGGVLTESVAGAAIAMANNVKGKALVQRAGKQDWIPLRKDMALFSGDTIHTAKGGFAALLFLNGKGDLRMNENTNLIIHESPAEREKGNQGFFNIVLGEIKVWMRPGLLGRTVRFVDSTNATIAIEGTDIDVQVTPDGKTILTTVSGTAILENAFGKARVGPSLQSVADGKAAPSEPKPVDAQKVIRWVENIPLKATHLQRSFHPSKNEREALIRKARAALSRNSDDTGALRDMAECLADEGRFDEAAKCYVKILKHHDEPLARARLAYVLWMKGEASRGLKEAEKAMNDIEREGSAAGAAEAYYYYALLLEASARIREAVVYYQKAYDLAQGDLFFSRDLGLALWITGEKEKAREILNRLAGTHPESGEANNLLGIMLLAESRNGEALDRFRKAVSKATGDFRYRYNLASAHLAIGDSLAKSSPQSPEKAAKDYDEARREFMEAARLSLRDQEAANALGMLFEQQRNHDDSLKWFRRASQIDPRDYRPHNNMAIVLLRKKRADEAEKEFCAALALAPQAFDLLYNLGRFYQKKGDPERAEECFRKALEENSVEKDTLLALAELMGERARLEDAFAYLAKARNLYPRDAKVICALAKYYLDRRELGEAEKTADAALKIDPKSGEAIHIKGRVLIERGEIDKGTKLLEDALMAGYAISQSYNNIGVAYFRAYDISSEKQIKEAHLQKALDMFGKALKEDPGNAQAHNNLGTVLLQRGEIESARQEFDKAARIGGRRFVSPLANKALISLQAGRVDEAHEIFSSVLAVEPQNYNALMGSGNCLYLEKDLSGALRQFRKMAAAYPEDAKAWSNVGYVLHQEGKFSEAVEAHRKALQFGGGLSTTHYNTAWTFLRLGNSDEALKNFREAARLAAGGWEGETSEAAIRLLEGKPAECLQRARKARDLNPGNADSFYLAGQALLRLGRRYEAKSEFERALEADVNHRDSRDALKGRSI